MPGSWDTRNNVKAVVSLRPTDIRSRMPTLDSRDAHIRRHTYMCPRPMGSRSRVPTLNSQEIHKKLRVNM